MKIRSKFLLATTLSTVAFMAGCAGGGYNNQGYNPSGVAAGTAQNPAGGIGGAVGTAVVNAIIQSMAASVLNGQIGSQLTQPDQNFRLQQLSNVTQAGAFSQAQQWLNPQTGNTIALNPIGQLLTDPKSGQNCRNLEEVATLKNGKTIKETRRACQNPNGQWVLTQ